MSEEYEAGAVGYKHPPREHQFRRGGKVATRAGDPRGRAISGLSCARSSANSSPSAMVSGRSRYPNSAR
jgi:hypothetical protein